MEQKVIDMAERIAALEEQAEHGQKDRDEMKDMLHTIRDSQETLNNKITRWEGKFGGVIFVVSCVWVFLTGLPGAILNWIKVRGGLD